jgi:hypothetical protein
MYWFMCVLALSAGLAALLASFHVTDGRWFIGVLGALFIICGVSMFIRPETIVESDARIVRRQLRLFGRFLVSSRQFSFSDFGSVVVRRVRRSNVGRDPDQFFVSLRRRSGRQVLVRYFEADIARNCRPAAELAQRLSADLQIEIDDHDA